jgi:nucleoside-diphosphate-sugar epimerase
MLPKQNILVTGANGFIGRALINGLKQRHHNIFALDHVPRPRSEDQHVAKFYPQDITKPFKIDHPFDHVFHLAALNVTHVDKAEYQEYYRVNVQGTKNLIKAIRTGKFVFMSTAKVYQQRDGLINEGSAVRPEGDYERSKWEAEEICRKHFPNKNLTIFRAVNVVGPGQADKAVIPIFFKKALNNEPLEIIYSPQTSLQLLDIGDLVEAFYLLLENKQGGGIFNLSPEENITLAELAQRIISICHSKSPVHFGNDPKGTFSKVTSQRGQEVLGWKAKATIGDILRNYYDFVSMHSK